MQIAERETKRPAGVLLLVAAVVALLACAGPALAHNEHLLIGRSATNLLKLDPVQSVPHGATIILDFIPPGGPIEGYSAAIPGLSLVVQSNPEQDVFTLDPSTDIWLEIIRIDAPLLLIETPSFIIVNDREPPELHVGNDLVGNHHPLWLLDTGDPAFAASHCIWEITFILKDKGPTQYAPSEPITLRFVAGAPPCPADFDCDGDVDGADFEIINACSTRSGVPYDPAALPAECTSHADHAGFIRPDLDRDGDVDLDDFALFQRCAAGEGVAPPPGCAD